MITKEIFFFFLFLYITFCISLCLLTIFKKLIIIFNRFLFICLQVNATIIGEFCKDEIPRLCDHAILRNHTRVTRPCTLAESYVSSGSDLTLDIFLLRGSVLFPLNFQLRYEFVDTSLEGVRLPESRNLCDRIFTSADSLPAFGKFYSPRSVFYYGRGGSMNLSCVFKFKPNTREKVQLRFTSASFGDR